MPAERVAAWLDQGLPAAGGLVDPVAAANWLADGRLAQCPVLARRWRSWFAWFAPAVRGEVRPWRLRLRRRQALHLPGAVGALRWYLPRLGDGPGQRVEAETAPPGARALPHHHLIELPAADGPLEVEAGALVALEPRPPGDHPELLALVEELAASFRYGYRHHLPGEAYRADAGSCLDCAMTLGARLSERGRPWRLAAGVVARSAVANAHAWIEVEDVGGAWIAVDPTLPAVARSLGPPGTDWRAWARAATGGQDARRVRFGAGDQAPARIPGGATIGGLVGEAVVTLAGVERSAWPCLELACGDCRWDFTAL